MRSRLELYLRCDHEIEQAMNAIFAATRHKLSVEDYHKLGDAGVLTEDSRVELINGELIDMAPIGSMHASVVTTLSMFFARHVGDRAIVSIQNQVILPLDSEPRPAPLKPKVIRGVQFKNG